MSVTARPRLGRGLKGLIATPPIVIHPNAPAHPHPTTQPTPDGLLHVPLNLIDPNPHQPRTHMDPGALAELVASVKASGILQPVLLRPATAAGQAGRYQLVAGHRRTEAAKQAGLATIPAIIRSDSTDETQAEWALIENVHREDLNPIERAKAYRTYIERFKLSHTQAAQRLGHDRAVVSNFLRLLDLNAGVQELVARGLLTAGHAKVLAGVADPARQDALANQAVAEGLNVRKLEELVSQAADPPAVEVQVAPHMRTLTAKSPHIVELEEGLSRKLGTKLRIFPSKRKNTGKIVIQYFSLDEFDRIVSHFEPTTAGSSTND